MTEVGDKRCLSWCERCNLTAGPKACVRISVPGTARKTRTRDYGPRTWVASKLQVKWADCSKSSPQSTAHVLIQSLRPSSDFYRLACLWYTNSVLCLLSSQPELVANTAETAEFLFILGGLGAC